MKNLVMGVATNYDWYALEPFVTSFNRYCKNADLVLFVDNISEFTRAKLQKEGVKLNPVPDDLKSALIIDVRWTMYKSFLDERGKDYRQVFLTDTRDVIFQDDLFTPYETTENFLLYSEECTLNKDNVNNRTWILKFLGLDEFERLKDYQVICCGTVLGTVNEINVFCDKMIDELKRSTAWGDEQAAMNYLIYEKLLSIENLIVSDVKSGAIMALAFHPNPRTLNGKILRGDGGVPAIIHHYPGFHYLVQMVDKIYRDKNFQIDETFTDTRSLLEQIFHLAKLGRIIDAYKLFTKNLFGTKLIGYGDLLIKIWESTLIQNPAAELLAQSIQIALPSAFDKGFNLEYVNKICSLVNFSMKTRRVISFNFKMFLANIMYRLANDFYKAKQLAQCASTLEFISTLEIPADKNFYLFKAKVYRESGRKSDALAAYEKALDT